MKFWYADTHMQPVTTQPSSDNLSESERRTEHFSKQIHNTELIVKQEEEGIFISTKISLQRTVSEAEGSTFHEL